MLGSILHIAALSLLGSVSKAEIPEIRILNAQKMITDTSEGYILSKNGYKMIRKIGEGGFGRVFLAFSSNNEHCAIKIIDKKSRKARPTDINNEALLMIEACSCPFVVNLHKTIESEDYLFLVMEYIAGGELAYYIRRHRGLDEGLVRFITAEIILALKYLHEKGILYKDIKPENIVITQDGHIKLVDFGLATKKLENRNIRSGTLGYIAPECLRGRSFTRQSDYWSLGCLMVEMLGDTPAFYSPLTSVIHKKTLHSHPKIPYGLSRDTRDILAKLLVKNPRLRLGSRGIHELMGHPFFGDIDWVKLQRGQYPSLIKVELHHITSAKDENRIDYELICAN